VQKGPLKKIFKKSYQKQIITIRTLAISVYQRRVNQIQLIQVGEIGGLLRQIAFQGEQKLLLWIFIFRQRGQNWIFIKKTVISVNISLHKCDDNIKGSVSANKDKTLNEV
jgi:hypothetical protein